MTDTATRAGERIVPTVRRIPWLTVVVALLTAAGFVAQLADDRVLVLLRRDPAGLAWSNLWRILTPLFIQSDGWAQAIFNLATLVVFGVVVELAFGRRSWLIGYFGAGTVGQLVGYGWNPPGGGNSVAVCGLVGLIIAALLLGRPSVPGFAAILSPYYPAALLGADLNPRYGEAMTIGATAVVLSGLLVLSRRAGPARTDSGRPGLNRPLAIVLGGLLVAEAVALLGYRDHHGAALLTGVGIGLVLIGAHRSGSSASVAVARSGGSRRRGGSG